MTRDTNPDGGRRRALRAAVLLPLAAGGLLHGTGAHAAPTPECRDGDEPTPPQTPGPFFKPSSPQRASLVDSGMKGAALAVSGRVLDTACRPVAGALLDFWHCDARGNYDNRGFRFRGHQFADGEGRFRLETLQPGLYPGRTRHIHVRVQAPNRPALTTQLYFPGESANEGDWFFTPQLLMRMAGAEAGFDFVLVRA